MLKKRFFKTKEECEVTFQIEGVEADQAAVVCESNGWNPVEMTRLKSGPFQARLRLPLGEEFEFRYLIDGAQWTNDEAADAFTPNRFGELNSVVRTSRTG